ncbi:MAG: toll/interleukin-1 receptor domain-containing protein, partial [Flavobacteriales bacterium]
MSSDPDKYDLFVSYAHVDNENGWITEFLDELKEQHREFTGGREPNYFFYRDSIGSLENWQNRIKDSIAQSRLFLAFLSPNYLASEWCRREWREWLDVEISKHILSDGAAPIYISPVEGFLGADRALEQADKSVKNEKRYREEVVSIIDHIREHRNLTSVESFYSDGVDAIRREDLKDTMSQLAEDVENRAGDVK